MIPQGLKGDQITPHNFSNQRLFTRWGGKRKPVERAKKKKSNISFKRKNFSGLQRERTNNLKRLIDTV